MRLNSGIDHLSMFLLGLFGTGHCLGMCGPLVVALPGRYAHWHAHLIYHAGRVSTYVLVGAVLGGIGQGLVRLNAFGPDKAMLWTARLQIAISVPVAIFLLLMGLNRLGILDEPRWMARVTPQKLPGYRSVMSKVLNHRNALWLFIVGLMLGLLPCGLSYGAFARALVAGGAGQGALMAALFGAGTLPGLLILGTGAATLFHRFRAQMEIVSGLIMIAMAVSLAADAWTMLP